MAGETIFQHWIVVKFILPFVLVTAIIYAVLEKMKLFGSDKHQLNAIVSGVIGLIFVGAVFPKLVIENLILFLVIAIVIIFVFLLLWGFVSGQDLKENILTNKGVKWFVGIVIAIIVIFAVFWATGVNTTLFNLLFSQSWSNSFWTNFFFIVVVAGVIALVLKNKD
jgi:hypothetical protein